MTLAEFLDSLQTTWPARAIQGAVQGVMAPGNAFASSWGNPVTTEQMIAPAANLAGLAVGFPGGAGGLGSGARIPAWKVDDFNLISGQRVAQVTAPNGSAFRFTLAKMPEKGDVGVSFVEHSLGGRSGVGPEAYQQLANYLASGGERLRVGIDAGKSIGGESGLSPSATGVHEKLRAIGALESDNGKTYVKPAGAPESKSIDLFHGTTENIGGTLDPKFAKNKYEQAIFFSNKHGVAADYAGEKGQVFKTNVNESDLYHPTEAELSALAGKGDFVQQSIERARALGRAGVHFNLNGEHVYAITDPATLAKAKPFVK